MIALALLLAAQNGCLTDWSNPAEKPQPMQAAGDGLWIGGIAFLPADVESAEPHRSELTEQWELQLTFSASGQPKFQQAQRCGTGRAMEISYDRRVISRPNLAERIIGPNVSISGGFDQESAYILARQIHPAE